MIQSMRPLLQQLCTHKLVGGRHFLHFKKIVQNRDYSTKVCFIKKEKNNKKKILKTNKIRKQQQQLFLNQYLKTKLK